MDYLSLVFRADTTQLDAANKKVQDLGKNVDDTGKKIDQVGPKSKAGFNAISTGATVAEATIAGLGRAFDLLGNQGGAVGVLAGHFKNLFSHLTLTTQQQTKQNAAVRESTSILNANTAGAIAQIGTLTQQLRMSDLLAESTKKRISSVKELSSVRSAALASGVTLTEVANAYGASGAMSPRGIRLNAARAGISETAEVAAASTGLLMKLGLIGAALAGIGAIGYVAFGGIGRGAREAADAQDELAQKMGLSRDTLVAYTAIASENGSSVESLVKTYDKLSKSMNKMDEDNAKTVFAFQSLGVVLDEIKNQRPEQVAGLLLENYAKLGQSAKATAAIVQLLGPNFRENSIAIKEAAKSMGDYEERVKAFGGVASDNLVKQGGEQEKSLTNLSFAWKELKNQIAESTTTITNDVTNWAATMMKKVADAIKGLRDAGAEATRQSDISKYLATGDNRKRLGEQAYKDIAATMPGERVSIETFDNHVRYLAEQELAKADATLRGMDAILFRRAQERAKADADRIKALSAAARQPGTAEKDPRLDFAKVYKLQQDALAELAKEQKEIDDYNRAEFNRKRDAARELVKYQEDLVLLSREWSNTLKDAKYPMLRSETMSPMEQARAQATGEQATIRSQFGGIAAQLRERATAELDAGNWEEAQRLTQQAQSTIDQMNEKLKESEWVFKNVAVTSDDMWDGLKRGIKGFGDAMPTLNNAMADFTKTTLTDFSDRLSNLFITGKFGFEDFVKSAITALIRLQTQMLMMKGLQYFGFASMGGGAMAMGGAFDGGVQKFATGGVVSGPTMFGTRNGPGLMGEAGPEGILPLTHVGGKLGVSANGLGGINIGSINITVQGGTTNEKTGQVVAETIMARIADARIQNATRSGGIIRAAFA